MRKPHLLHETALKTSNLKFWEGQVLTAYHSKLKGFLGQRLGSEYEDFLATPQLKRNEKEEEVVQWLVYSEQESVQGLERTYGEAGIQDAREKMANIEALARRLKRSKKAENKHWGKLLEHTFSNVMVDDLYGDGKNIFLTNWSLNTLEHSDTKPFVIGYAESNGPLPPEIQPSPKEQDDKSQKDTTKKKKTVEDKAEKKPSPPPKKEPIAEEEAGFTDDRAIPNREDHQATENEEEEDLTNEMEAAKEENREDQEPQPKSKNNFWLWLLLLILATLGLLFLARACGTTNGDTPLPPTPNVIPPFDSSEVGYDKDSSIQILTNRINVIISSEQSVETFAQDFKKQYPDTKYKIIYFGTNKIKRLQIKVPQKERAVLMKEIPAKLPSYKLLVFEEGLLEEEAIPKEADFKDKDKSWYFQMIEAYQAWDISWGKKEIIVAIIDDGFDLRHPELATKVVSPYNVIEGHGRNLLSGQVGLHGTHVAGTAVGIRNNNTGVSGVAPDCMLMPIRVAADNKFIPQSAIVDGILYAINQGADVINLSLGMSMGPNITTAPISFQERFISNSLKELEYFWQQLLQIAEDNQVVVVMAGGNQNALIGLDPMSRTPYSINVSAIDPDLTKADYSNFGAASTVSAPGTKIYNSAPNQRYEFLEGTSMAAPIVTGAVALLKSIRPELTNEEIKQILVTTGKPLGSDIGPLVQLSRALGIADSTGFIVPLPECEDINAKIDSLLKEVERLREQCPDATMKDTMNIPEVIDDLSFSHGIWESTTQLTNNSKEQVKIRFVFNPDNTGRLYYIEESGMECSSDLNLSHTKNTFDINQLKIAGCRNSGEWYSAYTFSCQADANGKANCFAQNKEKKQNQYQFTLIKVK